MPRTFDPAFRNRDFHVPPVFPDVVKLGRNGLLKPVLQLGHYIEGAVAKPPAAVSRPHPGFQWGMLANDSIGDCVIAEMLHSIEDFHLDAGTPVPAFTDEDAISVYSAITGYVQGDASTDQGTDPSVAVAKWQNPGLETSQGTHQIVGSIAVDVANLDECRIAIDEFVDLQIAIALPVSAQGQQEWTVVGDGKTGDSAPGSWGGHGIPYREYDQETFTCVTWGQELLLATQFHLDYAEEGYAVLTQEQLNKTGVSPSGVNWDKLSADFHALTPA